VATNSTGSLTTWSATSELILGEGDAAPQNSIPLPFPKLWPSVREEFIRAGEPTYGSVGLWHEYGSNAAPTRLHVNWYRCKHSHDTGFQLPIDCELIENRDLDSDGSLSEQYYYTPSNVDVGFRLMLNVVATNAAGQTNTYSATSEVVKEQRKEPPEFFEIRDQMRFEIVTAEDLTKKAELDLMPLGITGYPYPTLEVHFRICKSRPAALSGRYNCQNAASAHLPPGQLDKTLSVTLSPKLIGGYLSAIMTLTNSEGTAELTLDYPERVSLLSLPKWEGVGPVISGWTSPGSTLRLNGSDKTGYFDNASIRTFGWLICTAGGSKQLAEIPRECLQLPANRDSLVLRNNWEGKYVRGFAKATNEYGTSYVVTPAVGPISAAPDASIPTLAGTAKVGMTLAAKVQSSQNGLVTLFAWYRCVSEGLSLKMMQPTDCTNIPNESGATYTIRQKDIGFTIRVRAYLYNQSGYSLAFSRTTEKVQ
jgi:hypothetical protein